MQETAKRKRLEADGEEKLLQKLKPLGAVIDLKDASEIKMLAALVPMMKGADGGMRASPDTTSNTSVLSSFRSVSQSSVPPDQHFSSQSSVPSDRYPNSQSSVPPDQYFISQFIIVQVLHNLIYDGFDISCLLAGWELTAYKANIHSKHRWSVKEHADRFRTSTVLSMQELKHESTVNNLKRKLHKSQVAANHFKSARGNWKDRALDGATQYRLLCHSRVRVEGAMERLSRQLSDVRKSRDAYYQQGFRLQQKKKSLKKAGRWDMRTPTINLLTKEEKKLISINHVLARIKDGSPYSDLSINYGPKIIQDWGVSANNLRGNMRDAFAWMVTEDEVPGFHIPDRTTVSRHAVARAAILKRQGQSALGSGDVTPIAFMAGASNRGKQNHTAAGVTYSTTFNVHRMIMSDSVTAGKTGKSEAEHVRTLFSAVAMRKLGAIVFDTTSSNTGELHGLAAELNRNIELDLMVTRCLLHVQSLPMVDFGTRLLGATPSLHWGSNTPAHGIALMMFTKYVENREWKDLKEAYEVLWGFKFSARTECIFSRWKYVFRASIEARHRWGVTKSMALLKTTWLDGTGATGLEVPAVQPITTIGCTLDCTDKACKGHDVTPTECPLPLTARLKPQRHTDPVAQPRTYCNEARTVEIADDMLDVDAACLDEAAEAPIDWLHEASTSECNDFFESMFAADEDTEGGT